MQASRDRRESKPPSRARQLQLDKQEEKRRRNAEAKAAAAEVRALAHAKNESRKPPTKTVREEAMRKRTME